jgi:hypothetical protein
MNQPCFGKDAHLRIAAERISGVSDPVAWLKPADTRADRFNAARAFDANNVGWVGKRVEAAPEINVDEVYANDALTNADFPGPRLRNADFLWLKNIWCARRFGDNCDWHFFGTPQKWFSRDTGVSTTAIRYFAQRLCIFSPTIFVRTSVFSG